MYLTPTKNHWIIDIETDGLRDECTQIFVACVENAVTEEKLEFYNAEEFLAWDSRERIYVGHNSVAFDIPVLNHHWGSRIGISRMVDTFLLSMLYSPSLAGGHSLDAWGVRLKFPKLPFKDFTHLSDEMVEYCRNDVALTKRLFNALTRRMVSVGFTELGCEIETKSWHIIQNKQRRSGFPFDYKRAHLLYTELREIEEGLKEKIYEYWPPRLECVAVYKRAFRNDGSPSVQYSRHIQQYPRLELDENGGYRAFDWVEFNLGSPKQRVDKLLEAGWKPITFTKKTDKGGGGNPKVDEDSLIRFAEDSGNEGGKLLAQWVVVNSRANMIRNWMDAYNERTQCLHGNLWLANTLRYRHDHPNSANIPAVRIREDKETKEKFVLYGVDGSWSYESRDLWTCGSRGSHCLVGVDAKGIQLRVLANYLADEEFNKAILSEDPHAYNQNVWGLATRAIAKTILYAIIMGAGDGRIASEANLSLKEAKAAKAQFFERVPGMRKLINRLEGELKRKGRITLCDGTPVLVPSAHRVIPFLLQGDESKIMRMASILLDEAIRKEKIDARKVGDIHDEWQFVVATGDVERFKALALDVFPIAGERLNYNIIIEGDVKVGKTWAETH